METRCEVCLQPATRKCTRCGRVFCDLHVRYGGETGGVYGGGSVGYYCDECWDRRVFRVRRAAKLWILVSLLILAGGAGWLLVRGGDGPALSPTPWVAVALGVVAIIATVVALVAVLLRRR